MVLPWRARPRPRVIPLDRPGRAQRLHIPALLTALCGAALLVMGSGARMGIGSASASAAPLSVITPASGAIVGNGNLVLIETETAVPLDGTTSWVEVSTHDPKIWQPARPVPGQPLKWRFIWSDPPEGPHTVRIRAVGVDNAGLVETSLKLTVGPTRAVGIADPYGSPGSFHRGQLHDHSTWSFDGWTSMPPQQLAEEYRRLGFDWLAITDHNVVTNPKELNSDAFAVIPGYESTDDGGHIIGLFTDAAADEKLSAQERINRIRAAGGMAILAHPGWRVGWTDSQVQGLTGYTAMEIYNGMTSVRGETLQRNLEKWHAELKADRNNPVWAVAVDDAHEPSAMARGWIFAKLPKISPAEIRWALEHGTFYASNGPSFSALGVLDGSIAAASRNASVIRFIDQDMKVVAEGSPALATYKPTGAEYFIRVEAVADDGSTAWSQPFFIG